MKEVEDQINDLDHYDDVEDDESHIYFEDDEDEEDLYCRYNVTNSHRGQDHFDQGLRLLLSYQQEEASHYFLACLKFAPDCALAHALVALCHSPNYNFKGEVYYQASFPPKNFLENGISAFTSIQEESKSSMYINPPAFPSQLFADYHSRLAVEKVEELNQIHEASLQKNVTSGRQVNDEKEVKTNENDLEEKTNDNLKLEKIKDVEVMLINAIRCLNKNPGVDPAKAECLNGNAYVKAMREVYENYPEDAEVAYFYVESIMVLHAWNLFQYPTGKPLSDDVPEVKKALECALELHPQHVGLCHMYVHLCEMTTYPQKALKACSVLRERYEVIGFKKECFIVFFSFASYSHCLDFSFTTSQQLKGSQKLGTSYICLPI